MSSGAIEPAVKAPARRISIAHTIHCLHQPSYADANLRSTVLVLPDIAPQPLRDVAPQRWRDRQITIAPNPGEGLAIFVRHLNLK